MYNTYSPATHDTLKGETPHPLLGTTSRLDFAHDLENEIRQLSSPPVIIGHLEDCWHKYSALKMSKEYYMTNLYMNRAKRQLKSTFILLTRIKLHMSIYWCKTGSHYSCVGSTEGCPVI